MKIKFSRSIPFTPKWNGNEELPEAEQIKAVIKPMELNDLFALLDAMGGQAALKDAQEKGSISFDITKIVGEFGGVLEKYISISGLEDDDGAVSLKDMTRYPIYMDLAGELVMKAAEVSMPGEKAKGN